MLCVVLRASTLDAVIASAQAKSVARDDDDDDDDDADFGGKKKRGGGGLRESGREGRKRETNQERERERVHLAAIVRGFEREIAYRG